MNGWILLHRQIQDHWIWKDANKLKWWIDILLTVNKDMADVNIGYEVFTCEKGQSLLSIQSWATRWGVSKDTARNFFTLLEREKMITRVNLGKTTRLTVCNYVVYQEVVHVKKRLPVRDTDTNKEDILLSNDNSNIDNRREAFQKELISYFPQYPKDMLNSFYRHWSEMNKSKTKMKFEREPTWELKLRLSKWKDNDFGNKFKNLNQDNSEVGN